MFHLFPFLPGYFYYITLGLQAICVFHCIRRGTQQKWIWVIVFLPLVGCIAYFFSEIVTGRDLGNLQSGLAGLVNPAGRISRLENNLQFSNTFNNRIMLADAYLAKGRIDEAIELYTSSLTGAFTENEHVIIQLIAAYSIKQQYAEVVTFARKVYKRPQFFRSDAHVRYALALEYTGDHEGAEQEFRKMKAKFSDFGARHQYGMFLLRAGRTEDARLIFEEIITETPHLSSRERRDSRTWITKTREELKKI